uniref:Uncharacterized protein n=1 Tax=Anopheles atroparvus TaxID=41427 RepID=A0A182IZR8_ANOAO
ISVTVNSPTPSSIVRDELVRPAVGESTIVQQKLSPSQLASPLVAKTPVVSRIPIRTANAEKRARANNCLPPEYDESKLSPSEIRALRAQKRAAWRQARLKSLENDALQAQIMIQTMNAVMLHEDGTGGGGANAGNVGGNLLMHVHGSADGGATAQEDENAQQQQQQQLHVLDEETPVPQRRNGVPMAETAAGSSTDDTQQDDGGDEADGGQRWPGRFPRLAVKSRPGSEVVVRETEKVVEEKVTRRTEEVPGGGLRTVEYIEKIIETEVSSNGLHQHPVPLPLFPYQRFSYRIVQTHLQMHRFFLCCCFVYSLVVFVLPTYSCSRQVQARRITLFC